MKVWIRKENEPVGHVIDDLPMTALVSDEFDPCVLIKQWGLDLEGDGIAPEQWPLVGQFFLENDRGAGFEIVIHYDDEESS